MLANEQMNRLGRKRKFGPREPNGRLKRLLAADRDKYVGIAEMITVLSQPHRRGDNLQECESPLGRMCLRHKLRREIYDSGIEYGGLVRQFYAAKGIPQPTSDGGSGSGAGVSEEKAIKLKEELERLEKPLKRQSIYGFSALRMLTVHEAEIDPLLEPHAIEILFSLAQLLKKLGRR